MAKTIFRIGNDKDPFADIRLRQLPREANGIKNMNFDEWGNLVKRAGYSKYNTDELGQAKKITGLHRFYTQSEGSKFTFAVSGTILYKLTDSAGHAGTELKTGFTDGAKMFFADFVDMCFFVNGNQNMLKTDGTNVYSCGLAAPGSAPSAAAAGSGGSLSAGDYKFKVTYVDNEGNESNASDASTAETAVDDDLIAVSSIPVYSGSDYNVVARKIYRTLANGETYYLDNTISDNSTTSYDSTQADTTLVTQNSLEYYHGEDHDTPPAAPDLIAVRGGRIILAVNESLYYSKRYYEHFPSDFYIKVSNMKLITGLANQLHVLQVATKRSVERLLGISARVENASYFQFRDSYSKDGCYAARAMVNCKNYIVFLNKDGLYIMNVDSVEPLNKVVNAYLKDNMNQSYIGESCACFYDDILMVSYPKGANTVPSETVWIDFRDMSYGIYSFAFNVYSVWDQDGEDEVKAGSTTAGRVYSVFDGLDDDGSAIEAYDTIGPLNFGNPDTYKQFYHFYIKVKSTTGTSLRFYYTLDNNSETYVDEPLTADTTQWYKIDLAGGGQRAREITLRPRMSDKYSFEIQGIAVVLEHESPEWQDISA